MCCGRNFGSERNVGMSSNSDLLDLLLKADEGINIDFKQKIDIDTDAGKAKFIKIFLALANSPVKPSFIVLGVDDKKKEKGRARQVVGAQEDIGEERLQNLVNSYCTPPISFTFKHLEHPNGYVGIINITGYRRPYTPKERYIKLLSEKERQGISEKTVFIRHGSTTDTAHPEEIMEMERERQQNEKESSSEVLDEISDISSSLSRIGWSLERMERDNNKDAPVGYASIGILSGALAGYLLAFGGNIFYASLITLSVPVIVSVLFTALRVIKLGLLRSMIAGLVTGFTFGILSGITDGFLITKLGDTNLPFIFIILWGSIKGLISSIPIIIFAKQFGFEDF